MKILYTLLERGLLPTSHSLSHLLHSRRNVFSQQRKHLTIIKFKSKKKNNEGKSLKLPIISYMNRTWSFIISGEEIRRSVAVQSLGTTHRRPQLFPSVCLLYYVPHWFDSCSFTGQILADSQERSKQEAEIVLRDTWALTLLFHSCSLPPLY